MHCAVIFCCLYVTVANGFGISNQNGCVRRNHQLQKISMVSYGWSHSVNDVIADETNIDYNHDEVTYRIRSGEVLHIPQGTICPFSTKQDTIIILTYPIKTL